MAEQKHARRRTSSNAATVPVRTGQHARKQSKAAVQPRSAHTADDFLHDFLDASFDPAAYLNATLPPLASRQASSQPAGAVPLAELSAQAQTLLSQLNAQTTRLSNTLTQLTDDILRSGSRLAYEVELLRGETLGLSEMLHETLKEDIEVFVPGGLQPNHETRKEATKRVEAEEEEEKDGVEASPPADAAAVTTATGANDDSSDPEYIKQLQTLTLVRSRLESVIQTFGDAMDFTLPPSEVSVSSGFLSVSAPEPGSEQQSSEEKGQQVLRKLRDEIAGFLQQSDDPIQGIEKAAARIEELKELSVVWKGTAEEKGRSKFIESLAKMVEDRHRDLVREMDQAARRDGRAAGSQGKKPGGQEGAGEEAKVPGGFGLISQLQKLRSGL